MWLLTSFGFFSVVQKSGDAQTNTLTIRSRVRADLEALRDRVLPGLGEVCESESNDYRFRAAAPRAEVAAAMAAMVNALDYSNFKSEVAKVQGAARAQLYHGVWEVLCQLQSDPQRLAGKAVITTHPRKDDHGRTVEIRKPSQASTLDAWHQPGALAVVLPDGDMPDKLQGLPARSWTDAPTTQAAWEALASEHRIEEPDFKAPSGYRSAAGVVVREKDGRVWVVAPSNAFGGYEATFPKGTVEPGVSLQATALVEAFEESGLKVRLLRHLVDVKRSQSYTRYYLAERVAGNPADMGWETQAVMLVPQPRLSQLVKHHNDTVILEALSLAPGSRNGFRAPEA